MGQARVQGLLFFLLQRVVLSCPSVVDSVPLMPPMADLDATAPLGADFCSLSQSRSFLFLGDGFVQRALIRFLTNSHDVLF